MILGVASALILILGVAILAWGSRSQAPRNVQQLAGPNEEPLAGGETSDLSKVVETFPVPVFRPNHALASDDTMTRVSSRLGGDPEVHIEYQSGVILKVRPSSAALPTERYAAMQLEEGLIGQMVEVQGVSMFEVPQDDEAGLGSIRFDLDDAIVVLIGRGDFPPASLREVAATVVATAATIRAESDP